jgi:phosphoribosylformylglycinamidine cyclo-ligase
MAREMDRGDPRVLNRVGAFASLVDGRFALPIGGLPAMSEPVLVMKIEEPGSKQLLALDRAHEPGRCEALAQDLIHHLINDIAVMGARPVAVLDSIVCGKLQKETVVRLVRAMAATCRAHGCSLVGGETSEQPGVLPVGRYVLNASVTGVVDRAAIIDGSRIARGDRLVLVASNGPHTNGYTMIRRLLDLNPALADRAVGAGTFIDAVLMPHTSYLHAIGAAIAAASVVGGPAGSSGITGLAHITGDGIAGNLGRIIPPGLAAVVDLSTIRGPALPPVFDVIRREANTTDAAMLQAFNCGVGLVAVVRPAHAEACVRAFTQAGHAAWLGGEIHSRDAAESRGVRTGDGEVVYAGGVAW